MRILLAMLAMTLTASAATIKQSEPIKMDPSKDDGKHAFMLSVDGADPKTCADGYDMYVRRVMPTVKDKEKLPPGDYRSLLYVEPGQMVVSRAATPFAVFCLKIE